MLLFAYAVVVAARLPNVWIKGRFWAEEGVVYFRNARTETWYDALFAVHTGYLNLSASLATLLAARLVPLDAAPWVATTFALLIQLCPAILLMTSGIAWLRDRATLALAFAMLLIPHGFGEVWINTITSQFHLALCVALILAIPMRGGWVGAFRVLLLVLAPLSSPAASFLVPLFFLRAGLDRSWSRAGQGLLLASLAAVQALMVVLHPEPGRAIGISPPLLALVVYEKHLLLPLFGTHFSARFLGDIITEVRAGRLPWPPVLAACLAGGLMAAGAWATRDAVVRWLLGGAALVMAMSYFGALGDHIDLLNLGFGDRYAYVPTALFGLTLLGIAQTSRGWPRRVAALLVVWTVFVGLTVFTRGGRGFDDGSTWSAEVAAWRADHAYAVAFWPPTDWRSTIGDAPDR